MFSLLALMGVEFCCVRSYPWIPDTLSIIKQSWRKQHLILQGEARLTLAGDLFDEIYLRSCGYVNEQQHT